MSVSPRLSQLIPAADRNDIEVLEQRILAYQKGKEDEDRFKHYRLTRGVYGQRQFGVQMFRTKIPFGHLTPDQLIALADISERYTNGRLHLTTRQNVQFHYVKLDDSPAIWADLAAAGMTAFGACGNTVRNITASALAGVDPEELFDVTPYVQAAFEYFLRHPICQDMGRKIKPAFSSSDQDSAFTYFHDFGFIPRIQNGERGFKVVIGGGLGAVSMVAQTAYEFLAADQIIPFMEATIRVFDRYGEREKRMKARMKFLLKKLGLEKFLELVAEEWPAIKHKSVPIEAGKVPDLGQVPADNFPPVDPISQVVYNDWLKANVVEQKQGGYRAVNIRVPLGNLGAEQTRLLASAIKAYASDDLRLTINQGISLRYVPPSALPHLFNALYALGLALPGFDTTADITACPGTDTCALGVTNSTGLATRLEELIREEYPELITEREVRIKISGCMNACGQHMAANVGFHGSSIKVSGKVVPAMQVVVGGGVAPDGRGFIAEKVIKLPSKRIPAALRRLLDDYRELAIDGEYYNDYVHRQGKRYFYGLLKDLGDTANLTAEDFHDWGQDEDYRQEIGVGECAGVSLDVVGTILNDAHLKLAEGKTALAAEAWNDAGHFAYRAMIIAAKALLLAADVKCNTHLGILNDFEVNYPELSQSVGGFKVAVLAIRRQEADAPFITEYYQKAVGFVGAATAAREAQLQTTGEDKVVVGEYYKA
ncbi:nitrite reductase [Lewinellaceae bacterium SD302]|nr:nitrite reductase [Lewinellaceae bacterium SD302]